MGFKTKQWPWMEVLQTSGEICMKFHPKPQRNPQGKAGDTNTSLPPGRFSKMV